jgi:hemerythrin superfamily protein
MPKARTARNGRRGAKARTRATKSRNGSANRSDAISLLKADHREVERLFAEFESARSTDRQQKIAERICEALRVHTTIEEEIFYPAFLEATDDTDLHHEAEIEHAGAKNLMEEIEATGSRDDHFKARVTVLREMIRHHVKEEEQRGGMFSEAQKSDMDLQQLGRELRDRKLELMGEAPERDADQDNARRMPPPQSRSRRNGRELRARSS